MTLGRPFPPGNKCGRGRPKGSRNKRTVLAREPLGRAKPRTRAQSSNHGAPR